MVYENSFSLPLPQLLDLALGYPERGGVNFNILHTLLHVIIQQLELTHTRAEFIDADVERMCRIIKRVPQEPSVKLEEYIVSKDRDLKNQKGLSEERRVDVRKQMPPPTLETVLVSREPDPAKETVVVVMPFAYQPLDEPEAQCMRVPESRMANLYDRSTVMSTLRPATKPLLYMRRPGRGPAPTGPGGDIVFRKKIPTTGAAAAGATLPPPSGDLPSTSRPPSSKSPVSAPQLPPPAPYYPPPDGVQSYVYDSQFYPHQPYEESAPTPGPASPGVAAPSQKPIQGPPGWSATTTAPRVPDESYTTSVGSTEVAAASVPRAEPVAGGAPGELFPEAGLGEAGPAPEVEELPYAGVGAGPAPLPGAEDDRSEGGLMLRPGTLAGGVGEGFAVEALQRLDNMEIEVRHMWDVLEKHHTLGPPAMDDALDEIRDNLAGLEQKLWQLQHRVEDAEKTIMITTPESMDDLIKGIGDPGVIRAQIDLRIKNNDIIQNIKKEIENIKAGFVNNQEFSAFSGGDNPLNCLTKCVEDMRNIKNCLTIITDGEFTKFVKGEEVDMQNTRNLKNLENRVDKADEQYIELSNELQSLMSQIDTVREQSNDIEREMGLIVERYKPGKDIDKALPSVLGTQDESTMNEVFNRLYMVQCDVERLSNTAAKLMEDREENDRQLRRFEDQLEMVKSVKADREELDEGLLGKADTYTVQRKVSHDKFESALEDLTKGLQTAVEKLEQQESLWQQALDEIQDEIGNKLDSNELGPLKEFMNKKLRSLHERLKNLAKIRKQAEAAGTKKRLLKDVNCVSCDADVVMRAELDGNVPLYPPLPPTKSIKPYLTYELDMIRKDRKFAGKNMIYLERALTREKSAKSRTGEERHMDVSKGSHICNRYCGGDHTITTSYQRVIRMGHFVTQEGLDCVQLLPDNSPEKLMRGPPGRIGSASAPSSDARPESATNKAATSREGKNVQSEARKSARKPGILPKIKK